MRVNSPNDIDVVPHRGDATGAVADEFREKLVKTHCIAVFERDNYYFSVATSSFH